MWRLHDDYSIIGRFGWKTLCLKNVRKIKIAPSAHTKSSPGHTLRHAEVGGVVRTTLCVLRV